MPDLIRHPVCFFLNSGFRRNDLMRGKPRGIEPEVNKQKPKTTATSIVTVKKLPPA
jgi:hypothetical protein